jgi:TetR/AcrR family transcriptional regulator, transcriptional repressor of bet genes
MLLSINWLSNQSMGRPSNREQRRSEILVAFAKVLADHGYAGATIARIAARVGVAPGLIHHHFRSKDELLEGMFEVLLGDFRARFAAERARQPGQSALAAYADAALKLEGGVQSDAAKCWVGLFSEAVRNPVLFRKVRRLLDNEVATIRRLSGERLDEQRASAALAFVIGALVFGAFAPRKAQGFAAPALHRFLG